MFAKIFVKERVRKKEIIPVIKIVARIKTKTFSGRFPIISLIATAAPVLVFEII